jgi:hypothetical protein
MAQHGKPKKKTPCKHPYCPNHRREIDPDAVLGSERRIIMQRSLVKINNIANPKPPKSQKHCPDKQPNRLGIWADHELGAQLQILQERDATLNREMVDLLASPRMMTILGRQRTQNALRWFQNRRPAT